MPHEEHQNSSAWHVFWCTQTYAGKAHLIPELHSFMVYCEILDKNVDNIHSMYGKYHPVVLKFCDFQCRVTLEPLSEKTSFLSHIVEQHKSY
jgi:hypothetical protein